MNNMVKMRTVFKKSMIAYLSTAMPDRDRVRRPTKWRQQPKLQLNKKKQYLNIQFLQSSLQLKRRSFLICLVEN